MVLFDTFHLKMNVNKISCTVIAIGVHTDIVEQATRKISCL